jgi:hypothetical protein
MKHFNFEDLTRAKRWDRYKTFHKIVGPLVAFETGELMLPSQPNINQRRYYGQFDIELATTSDGGFQFYADKECTEAIPQAWLTQGGQQHIAIDYEQKLAIPVKHIFKQKTKDMRYRPKHLDEACALWTGPERMPVALNQLTVSRPDTDIRKSVNKKTLDEVVTAVTAAHRILSDGARASHPRNGPVTVDPQWAGMTVSEIVAQISAESPTAAPHNSLMARVSYYGFTYPRAESTHDFIYIK